MNMKYIIILCIIFSVLSSRAQRRIKKYVKENAVSIKTIEPDSTNYSDLEAIGNAIGDAKVVMLGEQNHGDASTFLAKTRLVKYLHEKKGFNVLAFESDFFALNYGWDCLEKEEKKIDTFLMKNIFQIWTYCDACQNLFYDYIPKTYKTPTPLIISGFDNQMSLSYSSKNLVAKLDSSMRSLKLPIVDSPKYSTEIVPLLSSLIDWYSQEEKDTNLFKQYAYYLNMIKDQLDTRINKDNFWYWVVENLIQLNQTIKAKGESNNRDYQMSQNLGWISKNKFPSEKIIVWAASLHISKYSENYAEKYKRNDTSMGTYYTSDTAALKNTYILGFTSHHGEEGMLGQERNTIRSPQLNSLENWIHKKDKYSFIDFNKYNQLYMNKQEAFNMSGFGHYNTDMYWTKIFDGVFFIREMRPCKNAILR